MGTGSRLGLLILTAILGGTPATDDRGRCCRMTVLKRLTVPTAEARVT